MNTTKIQPTPSCDISVHPVQDNSFLLTITVHPYPVPPVVMVDGVAYVRQGASTRRATEADLLRLRERRPERNQPFDIRPIAAAALDDLALHNLKEDYHAERLSDMNEETFPDLAQWLTQRQLGRSVNCVWRPNPAAMLLYGLLPQTWLPGAKIEFVRYAGDDVESNIIVRRSISGTLLDQMEALWAQLSAQLVAVPDHAGNHGMVERYVEQYPLEALKELARNLVQHRQYEGTNAPGRVEWFPLRIEFSNPGGPFGRASEGEFGEHTDYRNPTLTAELVKLGYVQQLGRGIRKVRLLLERNGNPPLELKKDGFTRLIVRAPI
ncbi:MAG: transcriptional regulator [Gammaproteobacteria bacterium]|nr:transcriptional regulator [Gammaproteobacteria bacterium]